MHGYVWEWCDDTWHDGHKLTPANGLAFTERNRKERVIRGGAWTDDANAARSASRHGLAAAERSDAVGFRCVKVKLERKEAP
jgi:formylglycine-generating enzyme required for sulfatase activity